MARSPPTGSAMLTSNRVQRPIPMKALAPLLTLTATLLAPAVARGLSADQVLIVVNERSATSKQVVEYYQRARGIPERQVAHIRTDPREEIDRDTYRREVAQQIAAHLLHHRLPDQILAIVLTKGLPLKIR